MPISNGKFSLAGSARARKQRSNILGRVGVENNTSSVTRKKSLAKVDKYLKNTQYEHLAKWDAVDYCGDPVPLRERQPRLIYNLGKRIADTMASKLLGPRVFPTLTLEADPITKELFDHVVKITELKSKAMDVGRSLASHGSSFLRFRFVEGFLKVERYNSNICYPVFDKKGELEKVDIKYVYEDLDDRDEKGNPKKKWYKVELGKESDVLYDNPDYDDAGEEPLFKVVNRSDHGYGFVQGEWAKVGDDPHDPDGVSLVEESEGFIDAFNYSLSQSDHAVSYNQDPQLILNGLDNDEMESLVKSSSNAWNMGRDGKADYLESNLSGVDAAMELRKKFREAVGDVTRVILMDTEKMVGNAQSAKAMEVLHGPLLDLIDEYRPYVEKALMKFLQKMVAAILLNADRGLEMAGITIPDDYNLLSLNIEFKWPQVFPMTMQDLQQKVSVASQAAQGNLVSRETLTRWLAKDFGIDDVEDEVAKIAAQPVINPFGF